MTAFEATTVAAWSLDSKVRTEWLNAHRFESDCFAASKEKIGAS
jgi:hypothetical protein